MKDFEVEFQNLISNITEARSLLRNGEFAKVDDVLSLESDRHKKEKTQMLNEFNELQNRVSNKTLTEKDIIYYMNMHGLDNMVFCNLELQKIEIQTLRFRIICKNFKNNEGEYIYLQDHLDYNFNSITNLEKAYIYGYGEALKDMEILNKNNYIYFKSDMYKALTNSLDKETLLKLFKAIGTYKEIIEIENRESV